MNIYDIAIIGAGPAGLNASIYASRYGLKSIVIGAVTGGLASITHEIGNWLGIEKIAGYELAQQMLTHAKSYETEVLERLVETVEKTAEVFVLQISGGRTIHAKTVILAIGTSHRHLGIPGEKELTGKGVSFCATCDGFFYRGKTVAVIGGNDSAVAATAYLGDIAEKVYLVYRKHPLRAEQYWQEAIAKNPKIEVVYDTVVTEIIGDEKVTSIKTEHSESGVKNITVDGVFVEIGSEPNSELIKDLNIDSDEQGFVKINSDGSTSVEGIWAAGDLTNGSNKFRQIVTAAAEGAIAAAAISKYLKTIK